MPAHEPPLRPGGATSPELRRAAQDSVRELVVSTSAKGHRVRSWTASFATTSAVAAVAAAVCTPVVLPLLPLATQAGGSAAVLVVALDQIGGLGTNLLSEAVVRAWDRLRSGSRTTVGPTEMREALTAELEAGLTLDSEAAAGLRHEVAGVLKGVDAVQVALTAAIQESAVDVRETLVRGLRDLGEEFAEFGWVLDEVNQQLTSIAADVAQTAAHTRALAVSQQQTLMELALLRQQTTQHQTTQHQTTQHQTTQHQVSGPQTTEQRRHEPNHNRAQLDASEPPVSPLCPYPGLAAFQPGDVKRFFGRDQLTATLTARLGEQLIRPGLLMVLGPSGSGKSSLLRAGLLPAIAAGALPARGAQGWPRDLMTPGRRPLLELATRIAALSTVIPGELEADLRTDPTRITGAIRQALLVHARRSAELSDSTSPGPPRVIDLDADGQPGPRLVLVIDQFEELFSQCPDEQERRTFIRALAAAAGVGRPAPATDQGDQDDRGDQDDQADDSTGRWTDARDAPALVVIGVRADFYAQTTAYPELLPFLQDRPVLVGPIDETGLRAAIEQPAANAGLVVDPELVEVLLSDLGGPAYEAGRLALLSYALQQTWGNREGRHLTLAGYRATGGIDDAIAQAADRVYNRLDPGGRDAVRHVLLRLVSLGERTADTRRRVSRAELTSARASAITATRRRVLTALIDARLVTANADSIEISHETLLTAWPQLRLWLGQDRAGLRIHRDLTEASRQWRLAEGDSSHLFRGTRLAVTKGLGRAARARPQPR